MLYIILGQDAPATLETRKRVRAAHLARIRVLADAGRITVAGPCPVHDTPEPTPAGFSGSVIIAEFESLEAARRWIAEDPYVTEGVFASVEVRPFIKVLP